MIWILWLACDDTTPDEACPEGLQSGYVDADGDTYGDDDTYGTVCGGEVVDRGGDCDDSSADVRPSADERCNGVDDDCNGEVDDDAIDASTFYDDDDGDGHGDDQGAVDACEAPDGALESAGDCDDGDASVHPGADEVCDDVDQDCDGQVDEDPLDPPTWYRDEDGDGAGGDTDTVAVCDAPEGYVAASTDCDDGDPEVSPDEAIDHCDGVDDDCDGLPDLGCLYEADATAVLTNSRGWAAPVVRCGDLDANGRADLCFGIPYEGRLGSGGVLALLDPVTADIDADEHAVVVLGELDNADMGASIATGDLDGDGVADIAAGAPAHDWETEGGTVWLVTELPESTADVSETGGRIGGPDDDSAEFGATVLMGDVTGDGQDDLWAYAADTNIVYGFEGPLSASGEDADRADWKVASILRLGQATVTDLDGDGVGDLVLGDQTAGSDDEGSVFVFLGPPVTSTYSSLADSSVTGAADANLGSGVAVADVDGDGHLDLFGGAQDAQDGGVAYLVHGPVGGDLLADDMPDRVVGGEDDRVGDVLHATDFDLDGHADLVVASYLRDGVATNTGLVGIFYGPLSGSVDFDLADTRLAGDEANQGVGEIFGPVADQDGDGAEDLLIVPDSATGWLFSASGL